MRTMRHDEDGPSIGEIDQRIVDLERDLGDRATRAAIRSEVLDLEEQFALPAAYRSSQYLGNLTVADTQPRS